MKAMKSSCQGNQRETRKCFFLFSFLFFILFLLSNLKALPTPLLSSPLHSSLISLYHSHLSFSDRVTHHIIVTKQLTQNMTCFTSKSDVSNVLAPFYQTHGNVWTVQSFIIVFVVCVYINKIVGE